MNANLVFARRLVWSILTINVLFSCSGNVKGDSVEHLTKAIDYHNQATSIFNRGSGFSVIPEKDMENATAYLKKALEEARLINIALMNQRFPALGDHCQNELIKGLELTLDGNQKGDAKISLSGQALLDRFGEWYQSNYDEIRKRRR